MIKNTTTPDVTSPIVPGISAGGFTLRTEIEEIFQHKSEIASWNNALGQLFDVVSQREEWIHFSPETTEGVKSGDQYFCKKGAIHLTFSQDGVLECVGLRAGYKGMLFNKISVGDKLADVLKLFDVKYDPIDEVHYPADEDRYPGLEFFAEERSMEEAPDQLITAIFVKTL